MAAGLLISCRGDSQAGSAYGHPTKLTFWVLLRCAIRTDLWI